MTCHLPGFATGDGRSLSIGQGASGLGTARVHPGGAFIPRNAPPAFNLLRQPDAVLGRAGRDRRQRRADDARGPAASRRTWRGVFEFGALSALPLFPVLSREEMRAADGNELADIKDKIAAAGVESADGAAGQDSASTAGCSRRRIRAPSSSQMNFAHASNAIAGFLIDQFAFNDSPWDRFLAGNDDAMTEQQLLGAKDFMSARCSICHNGPALTDGKFHNVAVAQVGPGEGDGADGQDDFGRMRVTGRPRTGTPSVAAAPERRAHRALRPRRRVHRSAGVRRPLQRVRHQASGVHDVAARAVAPADDAAHGGADPRDA